MTQNKCVKKISFNTSKDLKGKEKEKRYPRYAHDGGQFDKVFEKALKEVGGERGI